MEFVPTWQVTFLCGLATWVVISSVLNLTHLIRSLIQPWVCRRVDSGTGFVLRVQKWKHWSLDVFFSLLSCVVSVPFYTGFLPLLFWSGHVKLARQITLLLAFCDYIGNCLKDVVSAPRPSCPPVQRITATKDEEENAQEYGLPSSHTLNTVCLSGYMLYYILSQDQNRDGFLAFSGFSAVCLAVVLTGLGRIYLGMHSLIDVFGGLLMGILILGFWLSVSEFIDSFVVTGRNVTYFWSALSFLMGFAYPTPEFPTPSFEFHTCFNGVALGIVAGVNQSYHQFHHADVPSLFSQLPFPHFIGRVLVGIPTILLVKLCSKALAKRIVPLALYMTRITIRSSSYIPSLNKKAGKPKNSGCLQNLFFLSSMESVDVDTPIRFLQYAGLAWSVVDLAPALFSRMNL
ncbi:hypothetical protein Droror1_Dr00002295 [Drosera rotundifolia]